MRSYQILSSPFNFVVFLFLLIFTQSVTAQDTCDFYKPGFIDYCPMGVPDFDQKQSDDWKNPITGQYSWDGPVALANCMWWFDSKFEKYPIYPLSNDYALNDSYSLVGTYDSEQVWDDHAYMNVPYFIQRLSPYLKTDSVSSNRYGTVITDMESGFDQWLINETDLEGKYTTRIVLGPEFDEIKQSLTACQDVVLLLGFYEENYDVACTWLGGHYVTVAGINSLDTGLCLCDPYFDGNEGEPPVGNNGHDADLHNDANFASGPHGSVHRDCYQLRRVSADLCMTQARWEFIDYPSTWSDIQVFNGLNPLVPQGVIPAYEGGNILVLLEAVLIITPDSCYATGDVNNDGIILSIPDIENLNNYVQTGNYKPLHLWDCDMNGDGYIDEWDIDLYYDFFELGLSVFEPYGGFPVRNNCCVSTVRGASCNLDTCQILSPQNCKAIGGYYMGDSTFCNPNACLTCCVGVTGNVDCSTIEIPDISDITRLIDYLYLSHSPLCCYPEADVDGSGGQPDISDITRLIDFLYLSHNPLPDCPQ